MAEKGFSLVELSIVLVILGLLVGGVLTGQSLIRAAELRGVAIEYDKWRISVNVFKDRYFALPGDMRNATDFWGEAHATPATCYDTESTGPETCDGNGDGNIGDPSEHEGHRFWQHLANAGLIEGQYTGVEGPGGDWHSLIGENAPQSKMGNAGWSVVWRGNFADGLWYDHDYGHVLAFGGQHSVSLTIAGVLTPEEAWNVDTKLDDGKPGKGRLFAYRWASCTTSVLNTETDKDYDFGSSNKDCALIFPNAF